jgi:hypothetical protein
MGVPPANNGITRPPTRHLSSTFRVSGRRVMLGVRCSLFQRENYAMVILRLIRYPRLVPRDEKTAGELAKRTLTNLYNERPTWLINTHRRLDEAVFAAYGWESSLSDEEILEKLLRLNLERAEG